MPIFIQSWVEKPKIIPSSFSTFSILTGIACSITATGTVFYLIQRVKKKRNIQRLKNEFNEKGLTGLDEEKFVKSSSTNTWKGYEERHIPSEEEILIREQLSRNYAFLGDEAMSRVRNAKVVIVGCGGVGSHAAHMLLRSGVERLRLVDFDQVTLSSLNRHAVATQADVGTSKVVCMQRHFSRIAPHVHVEAIRDLFCAENARDILSGNPDFVLDCIDNLSTKIDLIKYCHDHGIKIVSAMGAGAKLDPSRIQIADISETQDDPLARRTRRELKLKGIASGIPVVYSTEKPSTKLLELEDDKVEDANDFAALPNFRVRILPVLGTIPALFGQALASFCLTQLAQWPISPLPIKMRTKTYIRMHREFLVRERRLVGQGPMPATVEDVGYILEEIWRGRSAVSSAFERLVLGRWDLEKPPKFGNLIVMTEAEMDRHVTLKPDQWLSVYGEKVMKFIESRFQEEETLAKWR